MSDLLQVQGVNSKGFGLVPKLTMQDRRITAEAKAIYSYFCSYAGGGQTAFPGRSKILADLGMSQSRYYKHFQLLLQHGYIRAEQEKNEAGRFRRNIYTLLETVPCTQNEYTEPCAQKPCTVFPCSENECTNSNTLEKQQGSNSNSQSRQSPQPRQAQQPQPPAEQVRLDMTDTITAQDIQWQLSVIKEQIAYDDLVEASPADSRLIDEIVSIILDVMVTPGESVRIEREERPRALVRHQLGLLDSEAVEFVIGQYKGVTGRITRKRQYLLTALYNARMEFDAHMTNIVNINMSA